MLTTRFRKALQGLARLARNPWLLNHVLAADETTWQQQALRHTARSISPAGLPVVPLTYFLSANDHTVRPFAFRDGGSLATDLLLLRAVVGGTAGCRYFEIGTWRGESAANVAEVATSVHTLNLSAAEMRGMGLSEEYIALHGFFSRPLANVTHLHGNSATFDLASLGCFDVVFIDGDHRYEAVRTDTRRVFDYLVGPSTIVVWHDASRQPGVPRWEVVSGILDGLPATATGTLVQVENTLCALYSPTPLPTQQPNLLADPVPSFEVIVKVR